MACVLRLALDRTDVSTELREGYGVGFYLVMKSLNTIEAR
jgi:hypothetical protein